MPSKQKNTGTREWAGSNENILFGCSHDCKYCYAKRMAVRHKSIDIDRWDQPILREDKLSKRFGLRSKPIMFPTTHDILPKYLDEAILFLNNMLSVGNQVLVVSKPHLECITQICEELSGYKDQILFRFSIGSIDDKVLRFWEPNAPSFEERLSSLKLAYDRGFMTSVSCEPMLNSDIDRVIEIVEPYVTDTIWLGLMKNAVPRCKINGYGDDETISTAQELESWFIEERVLKLYRSYKNSPKIRWKDSIKKVIGIDLADQKGLDI
jgi:DNA repair photolyase